MIDTELLRSVFAGRRGFPAEAFVDETWFRQEMRDVLLRDWVCIGFDHDAPGAGDVYPVTFAGVPLLMVRDADGRLRVYHNVCSHRGAMLVDEPGCGNRRLTCPYHRWVYSLDGRLEHTHHAGGFRVHMTPEADPDDLGLKEVRSVVWSGCVFSDISGTAESFENHIRPTAARLAPVDFALLRHDPTFDGRFELQSNWKIVIENFVESYHVPQVHPELQKFNPMSAHFQILGGADYAGQGGTAYGAADNPQPMPGDSLPLMASLTQRDYSYESLWIFPNLIVAPVPNMTFAIVLHPEAAGVTVERVAFYFNGDDAMAAEHTDGRAEAAAAILQVNNEDIAIVESCQRGRRSPAFVGGVFMTKQEATSIQVQRIVAGRLLEQSGDAVDFATLPVEDVHHDHRPERAANR